MKRRTNIVPFILKPKVVDTKLSGKLWKEAPGILRWLIDGCLDWQANGLVHPESVEAATEAYFKEQDTFPQWVGECCKVNKEDPGFHDSAT